MWVCNGMALLGITPLYSIWVIIIGCILGIGLTYLKLRMEMGNMSKSQQPDQRYQPKATNGSSTQRENPAFEAGFKSTLNKNVY